jgi:hypothetical protein
MNLIKLIEMYFVRLNWEVDGTSSESCPVTGILLEVLNLGLLLPQYYSFTYLHMTEIFHISLCKVISIFKLRRTADH